MVICTDKHVYSLYGLEEYVSFRLRTASSLSFSSDLVRGGHAGASVERRSRKTRETRAPSVTRAVICVSRAFCSTDQGIRETARSLVSLVLGNLPGQNFR